jgi:uncharacterized protein (DUF983 family)
MVVMAGGTSMLVVLARGLVKRCPRCGQRRLFRRWFEIAPRCPRCGLLFDRGEGFWLGTMAINLGVTELAFGALLVGGIVLTWPDVPWVALTVGAILINAVLPLVLFPFAKTTFLAVDILMHRMDEIDRPKSGGASRSPGTAA